MRQVVGPKKTAKLAARLGLPIVRILVRGGTNHTWWLCLEDGSILYYQPRTGAVEPSTMRHVSGARFFEYV